MLLDNELNFSSTSMLNPRFSFFIGTFSSCGLVAELYDSINVFLHLLTLVIRSCAHYFVLAKTIV